MRSSRNRRFTIYDMMEEKGIFEENPANVGARDSEGNNAYKGPVEYPKMLYHPQGETRIVVPAEIIVTPLGPKSVGEQRELIWQLVEDGTSERRLLEEGWHDSPAKAQAMALGQPLPVSAEEKIAQLQRQIAQQQEELDRTKAQELRHSAGSLSRRSMTTVSSLQVEE